MKSLLTLQILPISGDTTHRAEDSSYVHQNTTWHHPQQWSYDDEVAFVTPFLVNEWIFLCTKKWWWSALAKFKAHRTT